MRNLKANSYYNIAGLKQFFAIELEDYIEKMTSPIVDKSFGNRKIDLDFLSLQTINQTTIKEYIQEMVI